MAGELLTGVAALDWQRDQWLLGLAVSCSQGDDEFSTLATDDDGAAKGTVSSSLTTVYPNTRIRPRPGLEFRGVAGYGRGAMTLEAADALFTRTGAEAAGSLRNGVEAATTRLRVGPEGSWNEKGADGTSVVPTLSTALRYDAGNTDTDLGVEIGSGLTFTNPNSGLTLSAHIRGLLSNQDGEDGIAFREWGGRGSPRYNLGGNDRGLTVALSPSWDVAGSRADQLWREAVPSCANGSGTSSAAQLDSEIGYGFAALLRQRHHPITLCAGLSVSAGRRDWRLGGRFDVSPSLGIRAEGGEARTAERGPGRRHPPQPPYRLVAQRRPVIVQPTGSGTVTDGNRIAAY